jgi:hypothetical protein
MDAPRPLVAVRRRDLPPVTSPPQDPQSFFCVLNERFLQSLNRHSRRAILRLLVDPQRLRGSRCGCSRRHRSGFRRGSGRGGRGGGEVGGGVGGVEVSKIFVVQLDEGAPDGVLAFRLGEAVEEGVEGTGHDSGVGMEGTVVRGKVSFHGIAARNPCQSRLQRKRKGARTSCPFPSARTQRWCSCTPARLAAESASQRRCRAFPDPHPVRTPSPSAPGRHQRPVHQSPRCVFERRGRKGSRRRRRRGRRTKGG